MSPRGARETMREGTQLDLLSPPAEGWWEHSRGGCTVWVLAEDRESARRQAEALLRDLGAIPGGRSGLRESYLRMRELALRGRR